jgi:hypothetical protein
MNSNPLVNLSVSLITHAGVAKASSVAFNVNLLVAFDGGVQLRLEPIHTAQTIWKQPVAF